MAARRADQHRGSQHRGDRGRCHAAAWCRAPRRRRRAGRRQCAQPRLPARHGRPASSGAGPEDDSFWTWREVMYRFLAAMTPDDIEAVAAHGPTWRCWRRASPRVGEFHYLHNAPDGTRYADPAETGGRIVAAAETSGIGLTLLPWFYAHGGCGGKPPSPRSGALPLRSRWLLRAAGGEPQARAAPRRRRARDCAALAACRRRPRASRARRAMHRRPDPHPRRRAGARGGGVPGLVGRTAGAMAARQHAPRPALVPDPLHAHDSGREHAALRSRARSPVYARSPRPISATASSRPPRYAAAGGRIAVGTDSNVRIALNEELRTLGVRPAPA